MGKEVETDRLRRLEEGLDDFEGGAAEPALAAVGEFDVLPVADLLEQLDARAFVEHEEAHAAAWRAFYLGNCVRDYGAVVLKRVGYDA